MILPLSPRPWTRAETLAIAEHDCKFCFGTGWKSGDFQATEPCRCVLRAIFRECRRRFEETALDGPETDEFARRFVMIAKNVLDEGAHQLFRIHVLLSADWKLCCRKMGIGKGVFDERLAAIEQKCGRAFRDAGLWTANDGAGGGGRRKPESDADGRVGKPRGGDRL